MEINNEIKRIKSLFTDERLYGNLINESCSCSDADMVDELSDTHYVTKKDPNQVKNKNCVDNIENTWMKCVKDSYDSASITNYEIFDYNNGGCSIIYEFKGKDLISTLWGGTSLKGAGINDIKGIVQFWEKGNYKGEKKTFAATWYSASKAVTPPDFKSAGKDVNLLVAASGKVRGYTIRGFVDDNCKIKEAYITEVNKESGGTKKMEFKIDDFNGVSLEDGIIKKWGK